MSGGIQLLLYHLEDRQYALPLAVVERVVHAVEVTSLPNVPKDVLGVIDVRGEILPVISMRERLNLPEREIDAEDRFIIARTSRRPLVLWVDDVSGVAEWPREKIVTGGQILPGLDHVRGLVELDGDMVLVEDLEAFLSLDEEKRLTDQITNAQ